MVVSKAGEVIQTNRVTVNYEQFLKLLSRYTHIRVGVRGGAEPFGTFYFAVDKKEIEFTIRANQCEVTYSIMFNSKVLYKEPDVIYIEKLKQTII